MGSELIEAVTVPKSKSKSAGKCFPPGFRFHPTDEELILYYLKRKICRRSLKLDIIGEVDVYKWDPEELPGQSKLKTGDRQWFFFSPRDRKYPNGGRSSRATMNGYWKATGKDRIIKRKSSNAGIKKTLVYYQGRAPSGLRTDWVMHEYTMDEQELKRCPSAKDHYALYKIFKKSGPGPKNGEQYGAPFVEEEWSDDDCLDIDALMVQKRNLVPVNDLKNVNEEEENMLSSDIMEFLNKIIDEPEILPELPETLPELPELPEIDKSSSKVVDEDFLELDDLTGPEPVVSQFPDFDSLAEFDFYHDSTRFVGEGNLGNSHYQLQAGYVDNLEFGTENSGFVSEVVNPISYDLWDHDKGESSLTNTQVPLSQQSSGVVMEEKHEFYETQCPETNVDDGSDSWFSSALWAFVESIPTTPASASESSALMNRAFERMSSFSRGRNVNLALQRAETSSSVDASKRLEKLKPKASRLSSSSRRGIVYFSVLGVLFAILWVFVGSSIELLGRCIWW